MSEKGFLENGFIIDLSNAKSAADIILELSDILDLPDAKGKNICLKLNDIDLNKSQVMSINSLISSMGSTLAFVSTNSNTTKDSAESLDIKISELKNEIEVQELDESTPEAEEDNEYSTQSYETLDYEDFEEEEEENEIEELKEAEILLEDLGELDEITVEVSDEEALTETVSYPSYSEDDELEEEEEETEKSENEDTSKLPTLYLRQNLRSGQTMSYDGNILLVGDTNPGSEIIAKGDITVWGVLGGIAHAGARGNETATIRALKLNAIQLRISGCYARRPDTDNIPYIQRSNQFIPEEAMIENNEIIIHKINEID